MTIEKNRIKKIEGGEEAVRLKQFLAFMEERIGDSIYDVPSIHSGVHPHAEVEPHRCPSLLYRRMIEHAHTSNVHVHIGTLNRQHAGSGYAPPRTPKYPYWVHITGDIRAATWQVGEVLVHDRGRLTALDHPEVRALAKKYPDRPGVDPN